jgi:hypothetical protein
MKLRTVVEPYDQSTLDQLDALHVDHAIAALLDGEKVVGYTMCHSAGPKDARLRCECRR